MRMLLPPLSPSPQSGDGDKGGGKTDIRVPFPDTDLSNAKHRRKTAPHCGVRERQSGYATPTWALPMPVHRIHRVIHTPAAFSVKNRRADTGDLPRFMTHSIYLSTFPQFLIKKSLSKNTKKLIKKLRIRACI